MSNLRWVVLLTGSLMLTDVLGAQQRELEDQVRLTFDSNGSNDHRGFLKDPVGPPPRLDGAGGSTVGGGTWQQSGPPSNDNCASATIIPGGAVNYGVFVIFTTFATNELCGAPHSCYGPTTHSVWYEYTPDQDGYVLMDTFGSGYDTVLSVFDGCGILVGFNCNYPNELVCNDNWFFNTTSQVGLQVYAGMTYKIKVSGKGTGGLLDFNLHYYPPNDNCVEATEIVGTAVDPQLLSTHNAQTDLCEAEEDCELGNVGVSNSVWYSYVPPCDGLVSINTNGTNYDTVLSIFDGCGVFNGIDNPCGFPNLIACDDDAGTGLNSQLVDIPLMGGTKYFIKVADYNTSQGGGWLDFNFLFQGSSLPTAEITSPANFACVCDVAIIEGTVLAGNDSYVGWSLDYQSINGGAWEPIAEGTSAITASVLSAWNTSLLPNGYYLLRLTVENACGVTNTTAGVVLVDHVFANLDLRQPAQGIIAGGIICFDGSAWDSWFDSYRVEYRPLGGGQFTPVDQPFYSVAVINDPLVPGGWASGGVTDGDYEVRLMGFDDCGNTEMEIHSLTVDNTPPVATITAPLNCQRFDGGIVEIKGIATDANLQSWVLQYTGGAQNHWVTLASGNGAVNGTSLFNWDVSNLPKCAYTLRLVVIDESIINCDDLQRSEFLTSILVGPCAQSVAVQ